jgi:DNA-binding NtrC family response regulator
MMIGLEHGPVVSQDIGCAISSDLNVLISGGDHHARLCLARVIHEAGTRRAGPFVTLAPERSADEFTSAEARSELVRTTAGGTLFIEETAALSAGPQEGLSHLLVDRAGDPGRSIRIIAATAHNLLDRIASNSFPADLFYRLNTVHVVLPQPRNVRQAVIGADGKQRRP